MRGEVAGIGGPYEVDEDFADDCDGDASALRFGGDCVGWSGPVSVVAPGGRFCRCLLRPVMDSITGCTRG